ncbi:NADH dehydrogenase [ubiquinone] 1 alpha subcomplex subunit 2-like [Heteronotia binoei]|uniref:NADH dehydrogenase [ubiquinone] 1 alpha subcomplex subunit 2-like n=1 Tax=Heteronotia binoei TaxID=13085 RepID=UPI00292E631F|nr:NADH dehydrogenase [ubiquinone] 1 alpha subcomplex subunit 2-like [Heteronotia binoei]
MAGRRLDMMASSAAQVIKEIRIHLCQCSPSSQDIRDFIEKQYFPLKKENPDFPILIRECSDAQPKLWARYEFVREKCVQLNNLKIDQVAKAFRHCYK